MYSEIALLVNSRQAEDRNNGHHSQTREMPKKENHSIFALLCWNYKTGMITAAYHS